MEWTTCRYTAKLWPVFVALVFIFGFCYALCPYPYFKFLIRVRELSISKPYSIQYELSSIFIFPLVQISPHIHNKICASTTSMPAYVLGSAPSYKHLSDSVGCIMHKVEKRDHVGHVASWHLVYYSAWMCKLGGYATCVLDGVEDVAGPYCYFSNLT